MLDSKVHITALQKDGFDYIISVLDDWWGGPSGQRVHPVFFHELGSEALTAKSNGNIVGFLLGFTTHPPSSPSSLGYIHLVGIHPEYRRKGVGKKLYSAFMENCMQKGVHLFKAISADGNERSLQFHKSLGFEIAHAPNYAGKGRSRIVFSKKCTQQ